MQCVAMQCVAVRLFALHFQGPPSLLKDSLRVTGGGKCVLWWGGKWLGLHRARPTMHRVAVCLFALNLWCLPLGESAHY